MSQSYAAAASRDPLASLTETALDWDTGDHEETWLVTYADILSIVLTMVVLLFGRMAMMATPLIEAELVDSTEPVAIVVDDALLAADVGEDASPTAEVESAPEPVVATDRPVTDEGVAVECRRSPSSRRLRRIVWRRSSSNGSRAHHGRAAHGGGDAHDLRSRAVRFGARRAAGIGRDVRCLRSWLRRCARSAMRQLAVQGHTDSNALAPGAEFESDWISRPLGPTPWVATCLRRASSRRACDR